MPGKTPNSTPARFPIWTLVAPPLRLDPAASAPITVALAPLHFYLGTPRAARGELLLTELRLRAVKQVCAGLAPRPA